MQFTKWKPKYFREILFFFWRSRSFGKHGLQCHYVYCSAADLLQSMKLLKIFLGPVYYSHMENFLFKHDDVSYDWIGDFANCSILYFTVLSLIAIAIANVWSGALVLFKTMKDEKKNREMWKAWDMGRYTESLLSLLMHLLMYCQPSQRSDIS